MISNALVIIILYTFFFFLINLMLLGMAYDNVLCSYIDYLYTLMASQVLSNEWAIHKYYPTYLFTLFLDFRMFSFIFYCCQEKCNMHSIIRKRRKKIHKTSGNVMPWGLLTDSSVDKNLWSHLCVETSHNNTAVNAIFTQWH